MELHQPIEPVRRLRLAPPDLKVLENRGHDRFSSPRHRARAIKRAVQKRIMIAGADGPLGRHIVRLLAKRGHFVLACSERGRQTISHPNVTWEALDPQDAGRVDAVVRRFEPDVIVNQVATVAPDPQSQDLAGFVGAKEHLRLLAAEHLLSSARARNVTRFISHSTAFWYVPGQAPSDEAGALDSYAPNPVGSAIRSLEQVEQMVMSAGLCATNLRYGTLYGPGTWYHSSGGFGQMIRRRAYPLIGEGSAVSSFIHVEDAARATICAIEREVEGAINIVDDDPAPVRDWLPAFAAAISAPEPPVRPLWVARLLLGRAFTELATRQTGASNQKARRLLDWEPTYPSWREGFRKMETMRGPTVA